MGAWSGELLEIEPYIGSQGRREQQREMRWALGAAIARLGLVGRLGALAEGMLVRRARGSQLAVRTISWCPRSSERGGYGEEWRCTPSGVTKRVEHHEIVRGSLIASLRGRVDFSRQDFLELCAREAGVVGFRLQSRLPSAC